MAPIQPAGSEGGSYSSFTARMPDALVSLKSKARNRADSVKSIDSCNLDNCNDDGEVGGCSRDVETRLSLSLSLARSLSLHVCVRACMYPRVLSVYLPALSARQHCPRFFSSPFSHFPQRFSHTSVAFVPYIGFHILSSSHHHVHTPSF